MKKTILLLALVVGFGTIGFAQEDQDRVELATDATPQIEFEKKSHDFGTFEEGVQATYTFTFKNTGNAPLVLNSVKPSCGCTSPKWTKEPVAPGEEGTIVVTYNSKARVGNFTKTITVTHNGEGGTLYLTIRGVVVKPAAAPQPTVVAPN
ncbi:MAG: DUF1573 domain-containing protein [Bacteroidia bacterium]